MKKVYEKVKEFKEKYPGTIAFRLREHSDVAEDNLIDGEEVQYAFCGTDAAKKSRVVALTDRRVIVARKELIYGSYCWSINRDQICSVSVSNGLLWSRVSIKTLTETFAYIDLIEPTALNEIQNNLTGKVITKKNNVVNISNINRQIEICALLDRLYREKFDETTDINEKENLRIKIIENYNQYLILTGQNNTQIQTPFELRLK